MRRLASAFLLLTSFGLAQTDGPYKVLKTAKVGGDGGFDYVNADSAERRLYIARSGPNARINVFNLDTLEPVGEIKASAHGVVLDPKAHHGFASSKPIVMFDSKTLAVIKSIDVEGRPDGLLFDPFTERVFVLSHAAPNVTAINTKDGSIAGTIDLGGAPEQAATDGKGHLYIDIEDKDKIAVVDAKALKVTGNYDVSSKGGTCAGLAIDAKKGVLFAACRKPAMMVILSAADGKILEALPLGTGTDGAGFYAKTGEAFSSQGDGTLAVIKENGTSFAVEQTVKTMPSAKTMTIDEKTGHILLIAAEFGPAPAQQAPGGRPGRGPIVADSFSIIVVGK